VPSVVAEHLGAHPEAKTAHQAVGDDDADDQRTFGIGHDRSVAEKMR